MMAKKKYKPKTVIPFDAIRIYVEGIAHVTQVQYLQHGNVIYDAPIGKQFAENGYVTFTGCNGIFDPDKVQR
jgi:hypothetical protein